MHYSILEAYSRLELEPPLIGECSDIALLMELVAADFCSSIVPETVLRRYKDALVHTHRISSTVGMSSPLGLIWLKDHRLSSTARNFIDLFKKEGRHLMQKEL